MTYRLTTIKENIKRWAKMFSLRRAQAWNALPVETKQGCFLQVFKTKTE